MKHRGLVLAVTMFAAPSFAVTTYLKDVKPILDSHCILCHKTGGKDPDLTSFPFQSKKLPTQEAIVDKMLEEVGKNAMPPGNKPKLSAQEIATLEQWKLDGLVQSEENEDLID
jgi:mono/diheme cytochrome c family protein